MPTAIYLDRNKLYEGANEAAQDEDQKEHKLLRHVLDLGDPGEGISPEVIYFM